MVDVSSTPENNTKPASERFPNQKSRRFCPTQLQHHKRPLGPSSSTRRTASASLQQRLLCAEAQLLLNKVPAGRVAISAPGVFLLELEAIFTREFSVAFGFGWTKGRLPSTPCCGFRTNKLWPFVVRIQTLRAIRRCFHGFFWLKGKTKMRRVSINRTKIFFQGVFFFGLVRCI